MSMPKVFEPLLAQPRVQSYLSSVVQNDTFSHAYLFIAPPGSLKGEASIALAQAALCEKGGCGECDSCIRISHRTHPDVHILSPEGAIYMVEQIRALAHDSALAPIRGSRKVYILERADLLGDAAANALLKTLEEPPSDVIFILQGRSEAAMLPTIISRCQVVPFRRTSPKEAIGVLVAQTGAEPKEARAALAASGGVVKRAREMLLSRSLWKVRADILSSIVNIDTMDELDVLVAAKAMLANVKGESEQLKESQAAKYDEQTEFLSKEAGRRLEKQQKREISGKERESVTEILNIIQSYFRDCAMLIDGHESMVVNYDVAASAAALAKSMDEAQFIRIDRSVEKARVHLLHNVSPQLSLESLLFDIKEVLRCPQ